MDTPLPVRDLDEALAITGGLRDVAEELLREMLAALPAQLVAAGAALDVLDWTALRKVVHAVKGATAVCAVPALHAAVCRLQDAARAGEAAHAREMLRAVQTERARLDELARQGEAR